MDAVALEPSNTVSDLLLRLDTQDDDHDIVTMELSESDDMCAALSLDCEGLSTSKRYTYKNFKGIDRGCM